jgi:hypothetical protein
MLAAPHSPTLEQGEEIALGFQAVADEVRVFAQSAFICRESQSGFVEGEPMAADRLATFIVARLQSERDRQLKFM